MLDPDCCFKDGPCPCPPHPDVLARRQERFVQQQAPGSSGPGHQIPLGGPTGCRLGLNDGCIFPKEHFAADAPEKVMSRAALERTPLRGAVRIIVVLVDFNDQVMQPGAQEHFKELFFSRGSISTGSVVEYYEEVSGGLISLQGDVVGPFRMPLKMSEYANNAFALSNTQPNLQTLGADTLAAAKAQINFGPLDNDHNGQVDAFIIVHAGTGAETTENKNQIWSAKWNLPQQVTVSGVNVFGFLTIPEDAQIGVCCHELGHLLFGWPDLYDIDNPEDQVIGVVSSGVGSWCLMGGGSWGRIGNNTAGTTPCHPSAWCKRQQGWVSTVRETQNHVIRVGEVASTRQIFRLWTNGDANSEEYFLLENRQQTGYDRSLPGGGLQIWHVDDSVDTNRDEKHPKVGLMQADGLSNLQKGQGRGDDGDPFPGTSGNRTFNFGSNPSSKNYIGGDSKVSVTNISPSAAFMTMNVTVR